MLFNKRKKAKVQIVDQWVKSEKYYAPGVLISVQNGRGLLKEELIDTKDSSHLVLSLGDQPLMQLQGNEYFCPTCEKEPVFIIMEIMNGEIAGRILPSQHKPIKH